MQQLRYSQYFKSFFILADVVMISAVFVYFLLRNNDFTPKKQFFEEQNWILIIIFIFFWILLSGRTKLYSIPRNLTYTLYLERLITHIFTFILGVILLSKVTNNEFLKTDRFLIAGALLTCLFFIKSILFFFLKYIRTLGINHRNVMFLSDNSSSEILRNIFKQRKDYGFKIFDFPNEKSENIEELIAFWKKNGIHTMYLPSEFSEREHYFERNIFREAEKHKVKISLIPSIVQNNFFRYDLNYIETQPVLAQTKFSLDFLTNFTIKRTFDILFSLIILVFICSWLFPLIALFIKIGSKGPIFFIQKRYGFHDEVFSCIKFRTMHQNGNSSTKTTEINDSRITNLGKFLRKTSLDEMPQFINVLLGEMSVVGPRPHMLLVDDYYKLKIGRYSIRSHVKPGITGLAQVNGLRGDIGNMDIEMHKRILADTFYVKNWSFVLDLVIIFKTVFLVIKGDKKAV